MRLVSSVRVQRFMLKLLLSPSRPLQCVFSKSEPCQALEHGNGRVKPPWPRALPPSQSSCLFQMSHSPVCTGQRHESRKLRGAFLNRQEKEFMLGAVPKQGASSFSSIMHHAGEKQRSVSHSGTGTVQRKWNGKRAALREADGEKVKKKNTSDILPCSFFFFASAPNYLNMYCRERSEERGMGKNAHTYSTRTQINLFHLASV